MPALKIVINQAGSESEGVEVFEKLNKVSSQFLGLPLESLGAIPLDACLARAVKRQDPLCLSFPNSEAAKSIRGVSLRLLNMEPAKPARGMAAFLSRLAEGFGVRPA